MTYTQYFNQPELSPLLLASGYLVRAMHREHLALLGSWNYCSTSNLSCNHVMAAVLVICSQRGSIVRIFGSVESRGMSHVGIPPRMIALETTPAYPPPTS